MDKSKELKTSIRLLNNKLHFEGVVENQNPISIDYIPPLGDNLGYTSLELLLLSLSSCVSSVLLSFLRKQQKNILSFEVKSTGLRKQNPPFSFDTVELVFYVKSENVTLSELEQLLLTTKNYCPVWDLVKNNTEISTKFVIER